MQQFEGGEVGEEGRGGTGRRPEDVAEAAGSGDEGLEDAASEVAVAGAEGEEDGAEGLELGQVEVVRGQARQDFRFLRHRLWLRENDAGGLVFHCIGS